MSVIMAPMALAMLAVLLTGCFEEKPLRRVPEPVASPAQLPAFPSLPNLPNLPDLPNLPNLSALNVNLSNLPAVPNLPRIPGMPEIPFLGGSGDGDGGISSGDAGSRGKGAGGTSAGHLIVPCPAGYSLRSDRLTDQAQVEKDVERSIGQCAVRCDQLEGCRGFRFNPRSQECSVTKRGDTERPGFQYCEQKLLRHFEKSEARLYRPTEFVEQQGAELQLGDSVWLYAVGSSSLVWTNWVDQLHLTLRRLGYRVPVVPADRSPELHPRQVPECDDSKYFGHLKTSRFGRIGWSSWDFALDGWEGCGADGFRMIKNLKVKCQHGAGCAFSKNPLRVSDLAADASRSNITLVATWFNDDQHWSTHFKCFDGQKKDWHDMAPISIHCLLRTIKAIHAHNPQTWIVIMGKYPETFKHKTFKFLLEYNAKVKEAVEKEPKTIFVDFYMPNDDEGTFYQSPAHGGHPNCRGSQIMAYAVMRRLYEKKILTRGLRLMPPAKADVINPRCDQLSIAACHTSALCWLNPVNDKCMPYKAGSFS